MPIKVVSRAGTPILYLRGTLFKQEVFESTGTSDPDVAEQIRIKRENEISRERVHGKQAVRTFADAAGSYLTAERRAPATARKVRKLMLHFRETLLSDIGQDSLDPAYRAILERGLESSAATKVRAVITPLRAILEHAAVLGWCGRPALKKPKIAKTRIEILYPAQVDALILGAAAHLVELLTFLVGTGCRPSEAFELMGDEVDLRGARCTVQQKQGDWRIVELCPCVIASIAPLVKKGERVFKTPAVVNKHGEVLIPPQPYRIGDDESGQIKKAWATACRNAGLPGRMHEWIDRRGKNRRQFVPKHTPYVLRHSWASWRYCEHKDLIRLQEEGGWSEVKTVTGYTKLVPEAYRDDILAWRAGGLAAVRTA